MSYEHEAPLKVTLVEFSPSGGLFQFAFQMGEAIAQQGHDVELLTGKDPEFLPRVPTMRLTTILPTWHPGATKVESRLWHKARRPLRALLYLEAWRRVVTHLRRTRPDVVQWANWRFAVDGWVVSRLAARSEAPVMVDLTHVPEPMVPRGHPGSLATRPLMRLGLAAAFRRMDAVLVLGERSRTQLLDAWPQVRRVEVIPHGDERIFSRDHIPEADRCPPRILLFGTLTWYKGVDLLLDAFELVRRRMPDAELVIAGAVSADVDVDQVSARGAACGGVTLLPGYVPADQVAGLFGRARVVVTPYRLANQSGVVHLAHTFGRPVVATDVGDLRDVVVHERTGLLVPVDDPEALAGALLRLLADPAEAGRLGAIGRQQLRDQASWPEIAGRVISLYQELVDSKRPAGRHRPAYHLATRRDGERAGDA